MVELDGNFTKVPIPSDRTVTSLTNSAANCALLDDGSIFCFDYRMMNMEINGTIVSEYEWQVYTPILPEDRSALSIENGCVILDNYSVYCGNFLSKYHYSNPNASYVDLPDKIKILSSGGNSHCAILVNGNVYCWGQVVSNITGKEPHQHIDIQYEYWDKPRMIQLTGKAVSIFSGPWHHCAMVVESPTWNGQSTDNLQCWGERSVNQLGNGWFYSSDNTNWREIINASEPVTPSFPGAWNWDYNFF